MDVYTEGHNNLNEELWHAWVQKGKLRDAATAHRYRVTAGLFIGISAAATAVYLMLRQGAW
jgi:hypothetical protein